MFCFDCPVGACDASTETGASRKHPDRIRMNPRAFTWSSAGPEWGAPSHFFNRCTPSTARQYTSPGIQKQLAYGGERSGAIAPEPTRVCPLPYASCHVFPPSGKQGTAGRLGLLPTQISPTLTLESSCRCAGSGLWPLPNFASCSGTTPACIRRALRSRQEKVRCRDNECAHS